MSETRDCPGPSWEALLSDGDNEFVRTVTEKLLTYALGRGVAYYDAPPIRRITRILKDHDYRWSSLIAAVVASEPFQKRRAPDIEARTIED